MDQASTRDPARPEPTSDTPRFVIEGAIRRWLDAGDQAEVVREQTEDRDDLGKWLNLTTIAQRDAEQSLVAAILATANDFGEQHASAGPCQDRWPARGVRSKGRIFLAIADPTRDDDGGNGFDLMRLAVVEADAVLDLEPDRHPDLTDDERKVVDAAKALGFKEALERLYLYGAYQIVWDICRRLGADAVDELRRMAAEARS